MENEKSILSKRIRKLRNDLNLTQEELAKKLGLNNKSSIANYESGYSIPSDEVKLKMCEVFGCSMDYLMGNSENKNQSSLEDIKKYYEEKAETLLKNKYINELSNLNLSSFEIESLIKITTSNDDQVIQNYPSLLNGIFSMLSINHNKYIIEKVKKIIIEYNKERINLLNEEINIYKNEKIKEEEKMKKEHLDKLHPSISGKKSATLEENIESLINYMDKNNMDKVFLIPILGKITAGQPILAEENIEGYLPIDPNIYGVTTSDDLFYLRVSGQSMNLKIKNGDYALIHKQDYAEDGDIVVAIVNGDDEATLKRYKKLNKQFVLLEPMSTDPSIEAITVDLKNTNFKIIGKAIGYFGKF